MDNKLVWLWVVFIIMCSSALSSAAAARESGAPTESFTLDNGLKVIIREDHRAPVVVSQVWYRVGSSYEHNGITGISHMLEHMMFKGTKDFPIGELDRILSENGGEHNAFTGHDYTAYYQVVRVEALEHCFALESDRMRNLHLLDKGDQLDKERQVVMEERRWRTDDKPERLLDERFTAAAHIASPYHHPVIGWMNDIENYTVGDLDKWYQKYYAPNNAILVVVGDVKTDDVLKLAKQYFGKLPAATNIPKRKPQRALPSLGTREVNISVPAQNPYIIVGFNVPSINSTRDNNGSAEDIQELFALEVLTYALDHGNSSKLSKELVRGRELAAKIGAGYGIYSLWDDIFHIDASPNPNVKLETLEKAILEVVEQMKHEPLTDVELKRIKNNIIAQRIYQRDSIESQAMEIGSLEAINLPWQEAENYVASIQKVDANAVQKVAQKYLTDKRMIIGRLLPWTEPAKD